MPRGWLGDARRDAQVRRVHQAGGEGDVDLTAQKLRVDDPGALEANLFRQGSVGGQRAPVPHPTGPAQTSAAQPFAMQPSRRSSKQIPDVVEGRLLAAGNVICECAKVNARSLAQQHCGVTATRFTTTASGGIHSSGYGADGASPHHGEGCFCCKALRLFRRSLPKPVPNVYP